MVLEQWLHGSRDIAPKDGKVQTNLFFTKMAQGTVKMEASQLAKVAKNYLARAGVPDKYTAQSIRAAASSAAVDDGTSMSKVLAQGRWSTREMFTIIIALQNERRGQRR